MTELPTWRWHLDKTYVKLNGEMVYLHMSASASGGERFALDGQHS
jgi:hypothetical protein